MEDTKIEVQENLPTEETVEPQNTNPKEPKNGINKN